MAPSIDCNETMTSNIIQYERTEKYICMTSFNRLQWDNQIFIQRQHAEQKNMHVWLASIDCNETMTSNIYTSTCRAEKYVCITKLLQFHSCLFFNVYVLVKYSNSLLVYTVYWVSD